MVPCKCSGCGITSAVEDVNLLPAPAAHNMQDGTWCRGVWEQFDPEDGKTIPAPAPAPAIDYQSRHAALMAKHARLEVDFVERGDQIARLEKQNEAQHRRILELEGHLRMARGRR